MKLNEKGQGQLLFIVIIVILCGIVFGAWSWAGSMLPAETSEGSVRMIQPQGKSIEKDYANSQTNLNNSQANNYNAQATSVIIDAQGDYIVDAAQATKIVADSNQGPVNTYLQGQGAGQKDGMKTFGIGTMVVVMIGFIALLVRRK